jgi:hypothetical protein
MYSNIEGIRDILARSVGFYDTNMDKVAVELAEIYFREHVAKMSHVLTQLTSTLHIYNIHMKSIHNKSISKMDYYRRVYEYFQYLACNDMLIYIETPEINDMLVYITNNGTYIPISDQRRIDLDDYFYTGLTFGDMMDLYSHTPCKWAPGKTLLQFYDDIDLEYNNVCIRTSIGLIVLRLMFNKHGFSSYSS